MVRFAKEGDLPFLKDIWKKAFDDSDAFIDWNFKNNFSYENTLIAEKDGESASNMQLMPHSIMLYNKEYKIRYVSGVATLERFKRQGLVRDMFRVAFAEMRKHNEHISILIPFNYEFYQQFGYEVCYGKTQITIEEKIDKKDILTNCHDFSLLISTLDKIYKKSMEDKNGYAIRKTLDWQRILEDWLLVSKEGIYLHKTDGIIDGYAFLEEKDGHYLADEVCGNCKFAFSYTDKKQAMVRIINPLPLLNNIKGVFENGTVIKIVDDFIDDNNIIVRAGENYTELTTDKWDIELSINELTKKFFGNDNYISLMY